MLSFLSPQQFAFRVESVERLRLTLAAYGHFHSSDIVNGTLKTHKQGRLLNACSSARMHNAQNSLHFTQITTSDCRK